MKHYYENIKGWFDFHEIYGHMVNMAKDGDRFVEIGTANGKSAAYMCVEIANSGKKIDFITVDIFPPENEQWNQEINVREHLGQFDFCTVVKSDSVEYLNILKDHSLQFVFLDGKHEVNPLIFELMLSHVKVKKGGYIGGHDYWSAYPDVKKTVDAFCDYTGLKFTLVDKSYLIKI